MGGLNPMATGIGQLPFFGVYRDFKLSVHTTMQRPQTHLFSHFHFPIPIFLFSFSRSHFSVLVFSFSFSSSAFVSITVSALSAQRSSLILMSTLSSYSSGSSLVYFDLHLPSSLSTPPPSRSVKRVSHVK
jgi:hypothetical protein